MFILTKLKIKPDSNLKIKNYPEINIGLTLGALAKLHKATISLVMFVCLPVRMEKL